MKKCFGKKSLTLFIALAFSFPGATATAVTVLAPNGAEIIPSGSTYTIQWDAAPLEVTFKLKFSQNNGKLWRKIEKDLTGHSYVWTVPTPINNKKKCLIKVIGYDVYGNKVGLDNSDAPFTIEVVRLDNPDLGETLKSGNPYNIRWTTYSTQCPVARVFLQYTMDDGQTWKPITSIEGNNAGAYNWTVPDKSKAKSKCIIQVDLFDKFGAWLGSDRGNDHFTIIPHSEQIYSHSVDDPIPIILVHGIHSEKKKKARWKDFKKRAIDKNPSAYEQFDVYIWYYDSSKEIGFNGQTGNAAELSDFIYNEIFTKKDSYGNNLYPDQKVILVAHSMGGLVCRSFMNYNQQGDDVLGLITLATPHHGSPLAVPDWVAYYWKSKKNKRSILNKLMGPNKVLFDTTEVGAINLAWDNMDYSISDVFHHFLFDVKFSRNGSMCLSLCDANSHCTGSTEDETLLYLDEYKTQYGTLADLNQREEYHNKIVTFAAFDDWLGDNRGWAGISDFSDMLESGVLERTTKMLANIGSKDIVNILGVNNAFCANDGYVPLQSALFLNISQSVPFSTITTGLDVFPHIDNINTYKQATKHFIFSGINDDIRNHRDLLYTHNQSYWTSLTNVIVTFTTNTGLVAYYPFNGNANDESGNGNHGTVHDVILTEDRFGNPNSAYSFDGNDWISITNNDIINFDANSSFSISLFIKPNPGWEQDQYSSQFLIMNGPCFWRWGLAYGNATVTGGYHNQHRVTSPSINEDTWNHVVLIYRACKWELYLNGNLVDTDDNNYCITSGYTNLEIGRKAGCLIDYFVGAIDDIRIYDRPLSEAEIQTLANQ